MKAPSKEDAKTWHSLSQIMQEKLLDEKLLSRDSMIQILHPMRSMDWSMKTLYGKELIEILDTAKTEEEILERAAKIPLLL